MSNKQIILGIDPGTRITGYGIISSDGTAHEVIDYGCIRPSVKASAAERYLAIFEGVGALIEAHMPKFLAIETQFVNKNAQSAMKLGMAKAAALIAAAKRELAISEYAPKKAKLAVVGNGSASKEQVAQMIMHLLHLPEIPTPQDAADALSLAICHAHQLNCKDPCYV